MISPPPFGRFGVRRPDDGERRVVEIRIDREVRVRGDVVELPAIVAGGDRHVREQLVLHRDRLFPVVAALQIRIDLQRAGRQCRSRRCVGGPISFIWMLPSASIAVPLPIAGRVHVRVFGLAAERVERRGRAEGVGREELADRRLAAPSCRCRTGRTRRRRGSTSPASTAGSRLAGNAGARGRTGWPAANSSGQPALNQSKRNPPNSVRRLMRPPVLDEEAGVGVQLVVASRPACCARSTEVACARAAVAVEASAWTSRGGCRCSCDRRPTRGSRRP